jgi:MFS family permease
MSVIGVSNMLARVLTGWLADHLGHLETFAVCMTCAGVVTACLPLLTSYSALVGYSVLFGYFGGAFVGLYSVVTADLFGTENLPTAIGVVMCSWTLGAFVGAPMSGWIHDAHGSYTPAWVLCGVCMALSGAGCLLMPWVDSLYPDRIYKPKTGRYSAAPTATDVELGPSKHSADTCTNAATSDAAQEPQDQEVDAHGDSTGDKAPAGANGAGPAAGPGAALTV